MAPEPRPRGRGSGQPLHHCQGRGLGTVVYSFHSTSLLLGKNGLGGYIKNGLNKIPPVFQYYKNREITAKGNITAARASTKNAGASFYGSVEEGLSDRVKRLEKRINQLEQQKSKDRYELTRLIREEKDARARHLQETSQELQETIKGATIGSLQIEAIGLALLGCGIVMGTAPDYLIKLLV